MARSQLFKSAAPMAYAEYHRHWQAQLEPKRRGYEAAADACGCPTSALVTREWLLMRAFDQSLLDAADGAKMKK